MKPFIVATLAAAILAPCAQASAKEEIANRCMYVAASLTHSRDGANAIEQAASYCIEAARLTRTDNEIIDAYLRGRLADDVEQAQTQSIADDAQINLDAYDQGRLIGASYRGTK